MGMTRLCGAGPTAAGANTAQPHQQREPKDNSSQDP
jgi:hypothetical protein